MKNLVLLLLLLPLQLFAQDVVGTWVGIIHNDTTDLDLHYEIIITEEKGKLKGYSFTNFIVDGRSLTGVKSIKINKRFGKFYTEDDDLLFNNYPFDPPKGVKQLNILELSKEGDMLSGRFTTSRTKQYGRPVTGTVFLLRKNDLAEAKIAEVLSLLKLTSTLSFIQPNELPGKDVAMVESKPAEIKKQEIIIEEKPATKTETPAVVKRVEDRKVKTIQTIEFTSDSLILELYDNGYVDDDSVSVIMNGRPFMSNVRLSEKAASRIIYITPEMDSVHLIMFAENLGTIAPNSGLAIVRDGKKQHQVSFSGDLKQNAAIILRRKKKE